MCITDSVRHAGGTPIDLGIARDNREALAAAVGKARDANADVLVTLGGASVGEHDIVQDGLVAEGLSLDFWRIAMRPGTPLGCLRDRADAADAPRR